VRQGGDVRWGLPVFERRMSSIRAPRHCACAGPNVACACCVHGRVGVFFRVCARVHVRDRVRVRAHVYVHACSCLGHVLAHASVWVRVSHFRSPLPSQMQRKLRNYRRTPQFCPVQIRCRWLKASTAVRTRQHLACHHESFAFNSCTENLDSCDWGHSRDGSVPLSRRSAQAAHMFAGSAYVGRQSFFDMRAGAKGHAKWSPPIWNVVVQHRVARFSVHCGSIARHCEPI